MNKAMKRKRDKEMADSNQEDEMTAAKKARYLICEWCKVDLQNEASMRQHLLGQKHTKSYDVEEEKRRVELKCGLFIRGYAAHLDKNMIVSYFSKFGKILWVQFMQSFFFLDYDEPAAAQSVINQTHYLGGQRLMIKYRQLRKYVPVKGPPKKEESYDFIQHLKHISSFNKQVCVLEQNLQPNIHLQFPKYNRVCGDLHSVLRHTFPYCRIHPFGSTITSLGFNNSDVDVYISGVKMGNNDVPFLYQARRLLNNSGLFSNVIVIPQAKIPILRCVHVETSINCDINLRNMLGVCNSNLIVYYLNVDPKLRKLMIVLKFWAKTHKITGQNHLFTNYSLNLMLIFFLQHDPFQLPSVLTLQRNPQFYNNQDGWNGGFQSLPINSSELSHLSHLKLLEMFFTFYADYQYGINVICPYLGTSIKKQQFKQPETLPDCYGTYKQYIVATNQHLKVDVDVCIQDPFEHSRNTTPIVSGVTLEMFVGFCRLGKKFCQEKQGSVLFKLLTEVPPDVASLKIIESQCSKFAILMRPGLKYIEEKWETSSERRQAWFDNVAKFTKIVLEDFLKLNLTEVGPASTRLERTEGQMDVCGTMSKHYKCDGKLNLWQARKSTAKNNKPNDQSKKQGIVDKEIAITEQLYSPYNDVIPLDNIIEFDLSMSFIEDHPKVVIDIKKIAAYKNSFTSFVTFLSANLPGWFKTFEQEQNEVCE